MYTTRELIPVDYDELTEKAEAGERAEIEQRHIVSAFREKTKEMFHDINGQTPEDVEQTVFAYIRSKIDEHELDTEVVDVIISGSRCRGLESDNSDIDIVVEYKGSEHEDTLFNAFNEDGLTIGGIKVDINPITEDKTGKLATYLPGVESYLAEKKAFITDIFGQGIEPDDSEAVQTVRKAQELLDKLSAYKPLAKVEELEENNYNMIDNVLNNNASKKEEQREPGRISVKEKLAEKRAIIEQKDKVGKSVPEKDTEKKNQREM